MTESEAKLILILEQLLPELVNILGEIRDAQPDVAETTPPPEDPEWEPKVFYDDVRHSLFGGRITPSQFGGMQAKLKAFREAGWGLSYTAYALATSFHETAKRLVPVREGLSASDTWRKRNLRYYPYYGRGDVQLTWDFNYEKADRKLGLGGRLINNLDLALDPDISAKIMVRGMEEGWFTGKRLASYLPTGEAALEDFISARRIINGTDRDKLIAGYAMKFQKALKKGNY